MGGEHWARDQDCMEHDLQPSSRSALISHKSGWQYGPSDCCLFGPLKKHFTGSWFTKDDVKKGVTSWLKILDIYFFYVGIQALVPRWGKTLSSSSVCVEVQCAPSTAHLPFINRNQTIHQDVCFRNYLYVLTWLHNLRPYLPNNLYHFVLSNILYLLCACWN